MTAIIANLNRGLLCRFPIQHPVASSWPSQQHSHKYVHYKKTRDEQGIVDWLIFYKPGQKARDEYNKLRGKKITSPTPKNQLPADSQNRNLVNELTKRGVTEAIAINLAKQYPDRIIPQISYFDFLEKNHNNKVSQNPAGFLRKAIEGNWTAPPDYISPEEQERSKKKAAEQQKLQQHRWKVEEWQQWQSQTPEQKVTGELWQWSRRFEKENSRLPTPDEKHQQQQQLTQALPTDDQRYEQIFGKPLKKSEELF